VKVQQTAGFRPDKHIALTVVATGVIELRIVGGAAQVRVKISKMTGLGAAMTLFRIEKGEHQLTLNKLETMANKLKIRISDIFPEKF